MSWKAGEVGLGGFDRRFRLGLARFRRRDGSLSGAKPGTALVELFGGDVPPFAQPFGADEFVAGKLQLGFTLHDQRLGLGEFLLGAADVGGGSGNFRLYLGIVHPGENLPGGHEISLIHPDFVHAACKFGGHVDLLGLDPPVRHGDAFGRAGRQDRKPVIEAGRGDRDDGKNGQKALPAIGQSLEPGRHEIPLLTRLLPYSALSNHSS